MNYDEHATVTFCECAESDRSLKPLGEKAMEGFTLDELNRAEELFKEDGLACELIMLSSDDFPPAAVLLVRGGVQHLTGLAQDEVMRALTTLPYDSHMIHYGKISNKRARHCNVLADFDQEPDYEAKRSTVVDFKHIPSLQRMRERLPKYLGPKAENMFAEVNKYPSDKSGVVKGGIGLHGDAERRLVVAARFGASSFPLEYRWFKSHKAIGDPIRIEIQPGDVYIMSDKAVGSDWKMSSRFTLRHAAGHASYLKPSAKALKAG